MTAQAIIHTTFMTGQYTYAPVALFVYNRLDHTRKTVEALLKNAEAGETVLYVFSDGGKDAASWKKVEAVRRYLRSVSGFRRVILVERPENYYLERNLIEGITQVLDTHGRIIVLEDDIVTGPGFLSYMNQLLDLYRDEQQVMHLTGFNYFNMESPTGFVFTQFMSCWGWATWHDRWQYFRHFTSREEALEGLSSDDCYRIQFGDRFTCLKTLDYRPIPWDICWYLAIYRHQGLCVTPVETLVYNAGLYSGTHHARWGRLFGKFRYDRPVSQRLLPVSWLPPARNEQVEQQYRDYFAEPVMRYNRLGRLVRYFYLRWVK